MKSPITCRSCKYCGDIELGKCYPLPKEEYNMLHKRMGLFQFDWGIEECFIVYHDGFYLLYIHNCTYKSIEKGITNIRGVDIPWYCPHYIKEDIFVRNMRKAIERSKKK